MTDKEEPKSSLFLYALYFLNVVVIGIIIRAGPEYKYFHTLLKGLNRQ